MKVIIEGTPYKVYWRHTPPNEKPVGNKVELKKGTPFVKFYGETQCIIEELETGKPKSIRFAYCSKNDQFNKSKGRIVSLTKAIKHLPKDVRKQFWDCYANEIKFK